MEKDTRVDFMKIGVITVIVLSLSALHYTTFVLGIPENIRILLDLHFKLSFVSGVFFIGTFSFVSARYMPLILMALVTLFIRLSIDTKYTERGYRRARLGSALYKDGRLFDAKARHDFGNKLKFGRNEARLENLTTSKIHKALPVLWYEKHKFAVTIVLAGFVFLYFYLGIVYSLILTTSGYLIFLAVYVYNEYREGYKFRIFGFSFLGDSDSDVNETENKKVDLDDLICVAIAVAVVAMLSGHLRIKTVLNLDEVTINQADQQFEAVLVGVTSNGVLLYDGKFLFRSFQSLQISE